MLICMSAKQLAIRFTDKQLATLDVIAAETSSNRSAVVKKLVDDAEHARVAKAYASGYSRRAADIDEFGDVNEFHRSAEADRAATDFSDPWP